MTTIRYYCTPRQAGKTNLVIYEACKDPKSLILTHNLAFAKMLKDKHDSIHATSYNAFIKHYAFKPIKRLILDEYHFANLHDREKLHDYVCSNAERIEEIFVFTTPVKQIPSELFDYVASCKAQDCSLQYAIEGRNLRKAFPKWFLLPIDMEGLQIMVHELWYDLLFLDCNRHNVGRFLVRFHDSDERLPFFNYGLGKMREAFERDMLLPEVEITGQYIIK